MTRVLLTLTLVLSAVPAVLAQTTPAPATAPPAAQAPVADTESTYDRLWRQFSTWYDDRTNPVVQRVQLSGRFQHEFVSVGADQGDLDEWNTRRFRVGPRVQLFRTLTVASEVELNPQERDPFYVRLTDVYVQWSRNAALAVTVGKQGMPFTMDGSTSSKELLTIDRSNLTNNMWFPQEYLPGISVSGRAAPWTYRAGLYSAGEANREFGKFDGGVTTLALLGYDFGQRLGVKEALLSGNYVYQSPDTDNTFTRQLEHVMSLNLKLEDDRWGLRTDLSTGAGYFSQRDLWGVMLMPYFNVTDKLQAITRYTYLNSAGPNGVQLATYENRVVRGRGDEYNEFYLGANYFFYGQKLKLQSGLQWADMNDAAADGGDYSGASWTTGLRIGWP
jgi:phosphate-selective porin OprO and OprP